MIHDVIVMRQLVEQLNEYRNAYYNDNESLVTDLEYDNLYDNLVKLEEKCGVVLSNSPTRTVGYKVASDLPEVKHNFPPMLSLNKSKELKDMKKFLGTRPALVMAKMDGLTIRITYKDGKVWRAETRGDGEVGEDVTHNISFVKDVPLQIPVQEEVIVDGEVIVTRDNFARLREKFVDNKGKKYKNARNFAAGSIRLHDSQKAAERCLQFVAWKFVKGSEYKHFSSRLNHLAEYGFNTTPYFELVRAMDESDYKVATDNIQEICEKLNYPIDGCVFSFNECEYMDSLGFTSHHSKAQLAYKFYDEKYDTVIRGIDWTMGKTGALTPTAMFDTVEIDGTDVCRANLHNLTIMKQLNVRKDCTARVFKANMIIPQVDSVDDDGVADFEIPTSCPVCGGNTKVTKENDSEVLICSNPNCKGKLLGKLCTFVSKQGFDIDGLSEGKLEFLIDNNYVTDFQDIFTLYKRGYRLENEQGWGEHSVRKLLDEIDRSKNISVENFLSAMSIPNVGLTTAKSIAEHFSNDMEKIVEALDNEFDWSTISGFGEKTSEQINSWYSKNFSIFNNILSYVTIKKPEVKEVVLTNSPIAGKTFCITGKFEYPRSAIQKEIEACGGIFVNSVTKKTDVLFVGDDAGSKLKKAQELGITIVEEEHFRAWLDGIE